jgi:hypothetical protein
MRCLFGFICVLALGLMGCGDEGPECRIDADCDDQNACTDDFCHVGGCWSEEPSDCEDDDQCIYDECDPDTGCPIRKPNGTRCGAYRWSCSPSPFGFNFCDAYQIGRCMDGACITR